MDKPMQKSREILVQLLYAMEENGSFAGDFINIFMNVFKVTRKNILEYVSLALLIFEEKKEYDCYLGDISIEYSLDRIAKVDLAILRVILYELKRDLIPIEVAVAEAIRIAKKFSSYGAGKYLHAMIDSIYKEMKCAAKSVC